MNRKPVCLVYLVSLVLLVESAQRLNLPHKTNQTD